ncbi:hypothetical protein CYLTODRAFT_490257 [Cylindrobasidium torrendii FP15055 ss-10]|uniref:Uncharacterized protein n=1 Tax=Cylindrobasidium torrendii FP15055 ss-10 TaxID=1314674 RepID=A0A0D7BCG0_9AGAR|nr:hypothetical protein CYLTODRAFT_490257 [Cylindrobasidium torrendii FP15055 ss-10]
MATSFPYTSGDDDDYFYSGNLHSSNKNHNASYLSPPHTRVQTLSNASTLVEDTYPASSSSYAIAFSKSASSFFSFSARKDKDLPTLPPIPRLPSIDFPSLPSLSPTPRPPTIVFAEECWAPHSPADFEDDVGRVDVLDFLDGACDEESAQSWESCTTLGDEASLLVPVEEERKSLRKSGRARAASDSAKEKLSSFARNVLNSFGRKKGHQRVRSVDSGRC